MSTLDAMDENMVGKVLYAVKYIPSEDGLLQALKKPSRLAGLRPHPKFRVKDLYADFIVGDDKQRCKLDAERNLHFEADLHATLHVKLYLKDESEGKCVASLECSIEQILSSEKSVAVLIHSQDQSVPSFPSLRLIATMTSLKCIPEDLTSLAEKLALEERWNNMSKWVRRVIGLGVAVSELNPISKSVLAILQLGVKGLEKRKEFLQDILSLLDETSDACAIVIAADTEVFQDKRVEQSKVCRVLIKDICNVLSFVKCLSSYSIVQRTGTDIHDRATELRAILAKRTRSVQTAGQTDIQNAMYRVEDIVYDHRAEALLECLPIAKLVQAGSTKSCLFDTRVNILAAIMDWISDSKGRRCFVLHGLAGKGKSAVANTIALSLRQLEGAAPFFAFDRADRSRQAHQLYPTLASHLARYDRQFREGICALARDRLTTIDIADQHSTYMIDCLHRYSACGPTIFVIDALDECPNDSMESFEHRRVLLETLQKSIADDRLPPDIRFFITTRRGDEDIEQLLEDKVNIASLSIDAEGDTKDDIRKFVKEQLGKTDAALVEPVARAAQDHFLCAAIICNELRGPRRLKTNAERRTFVQKIEQSPGHSQLGAIYRFILKAHIGERVEYLLIFRQLLAWIFTVRLPQPRMVFREIASELLVGESIDNVLLNLGSLMTGTMEEDNGPIRPLHTSFRDFVFAHEAGKFCITAELAAANSQLAHACFRIMSRQGSGLRYNICDLPSPFVFRRNIQDTEKRIALHIIPSLQYACREFSAHLCAGIEPDLVPVLKDFMRM